MSMCNCIELANEALAKRNAWIVTKTVMNIQTGAERETICVPLEKINKRVRAPIPWIACKFCPFCGERWSLEDLKSQPSDA